MTTALKASKYMGLRFLLQPDTTPKSSTTPAVGLRHFLSSKQGIDTQVQEIGRGFARAGPSSCHEKP
jgi:hypothetical protein